MSLFLIYIYIYYIYTYVYIHIYVYIPRYIIYIYIRFWMTLPRKLNRLPTCWFFFKSIRRTPGIPSKMFVWILSHFSWSFFDQVRSNGFITSSMMFTINTDGFGKGCPKHFIQLWILTASIARRNRASSGKIQSTLLAGCSILTVAQRIVLGKDCKGSPFLEYI